MRLGGRKDLAEEVASKCRLAGRVLWKQEEHLGENVLGRGSGKCKNLKQEWDLAGSYLNSFNAVTCTSS